MKRLPFFFDPIPIAERGRGLPGGGKCIATGEGPRIIKRYVNARKLEFDEFVQAAIDFYKNARFEGERKVGLRFILKHQEKQGNKIDESTETGWEELLRQTAINIPGLACEARRIKRGEYDFDIKHLSYYKGIDPNWEESIPKSEAATQIAIARTLTYIQLYPSINDLVSLNTIYDDNEISNTRTPMILKEFSDSESCYIDNFEVRRECWNSIISHPAFIRQSKQARFGCAMTINQHCMDRLYRRFGQHNDLVLDPKQIGRLRLSLWKKKPEAEPWYEAFQVFQTLHYYDDVFEFAWRKDNFDKIWRAGKWAPMEFIRKRIH